MPYIQQARILLRTLGLSENIITSLEKFLTVKDIEELQTTPLSEHLMAYISTTQPNRLYIEAEDMQEIFELERPFLESIRQHSPLCGKP